MNTVRLSGPRSGYSDAAVDGNAVALAGQAAENEVIIRDMFSAEFLLDIFARADTTLLGGGTLPANLTPKLGKWLGGELAAEEAVVLSDRQLPKQADRFALAHASLGPAQPRLAILVPTAALPRPLSRRVARSAVPAAACCLRR